MSKDKTLIPYIPQTDAVCPHKSKLVDAIVKKVRSEQRLKEDEERRRKLHKLCLQNAVKTVKTSK